MTTESAVEVPSSLADHLIERLAALSGQPEGVAEVALSALRYGSLAALIAHRVIQPVDTEGDTADEIVLTSYGRELIDACAEQLSEDGAAARRGAAADDSHSETFGAPIPDDKRLTTELIERLGALARQPEGVAEVALSAMPYRALAALAAHGIIVEVGVESADEIVITNLGRDAIEVCAAECRKATTSNGDSRGGIPFIPDFALTIDTSITLGAVSRFEGPAPRYDDVVTHVEAKLRGVGRSRQKVMSIPGFTGPFQLWVSDPAYDIRYHVRHIAAPQPGDTAALEELAATLFSQRLDRTRPLWEVWFVEGLEDDGFALISKVHPALLEGATGVDLLMTLFDLTSDRTLASEPTSFGPEPGMTAALRDAARTAARLARPSAPVSLVRQTAKGLVRFLNAAPASELNVPTGRNRRVALVSLPLHEVKEVKDRFKDELGTSVNDVVLALVAGALRTWMIESRESDTTGVELRALSVKTRGARDDRPLEGRLDRLVACLPVYEPDPIERLRYVTESTRAATEENGGANGHAEHPPDWISGAQDAARATMLTLASQFSFLSRSFNLIVANVPGSTLPLYVLGRRLQGVHPMPFLPSNHALSISAVSHDGGLYFGLVGDRDALEDVRVIGDGLERALHETVAASRAGASVRDSEAVLA